MMDDIENNPHRRIFRAVAALRPDTAVTLRGHSVDGVSLDDGSVPPSLADINQWLLDNGFETVE